ncbi:MAG: MutS protein msh4 [Geoglossum simile]|nr:MAG: MutS protein msh4 [Geoglossum simile]
MARTARPATSFSVASTSYDYASSSTRPATRRRSSGRLRSGTRPRSAASTAGGVNSQRIVCAVNESRGISPTVGLAFVNISTGEAVLSQICDTQTYVRTMHKLVVFDPSEILIANTAFNPKSKMLSFIEENIPDIHIVPLDRKYYAETTGLDYIQQLAFVEDVEAIKIAIGGNYFATCCLAAVCGYFSGNPSSFLDLLLLMQLQALKYIELNLQISFAFHSLRIKYRPSEGSMMIDPSTIYSLELIQNLQNPMSTDCLFGLLNQTLTPMGSRLLRSNILQPLTEIETLEARLDALEELTTNEEMFFGTRQGRL